MMDWKMTHLHKESHNKTSLFFELSFWILVQLGSSLCCLRQTRGNHREPEGTKHSDTTRKRGHEKTRKREHEKTRQRENDTTRTREDEFQVFSAAPCAVCATHEGKSIEIRGVFGSSLCCLYYTRGNRSNIEFRSAPRGPLAGKRLPT